jgi:hypothetical protein
MDSIKGSYRRRVSVKFVLHGLILYHSLTGVVVFVAVYLKILINLEPFTVVYLALAAPQFELL